MSNKEKEQIKVIKDKRDELSRVYKLLKFITIWCAVICPLTLVVTLPEYIKVKEDYKFYSSLSVLACVIEVLDKHANKDDKQK